MSTRLDLDAILAPKREFSLAGEVVDVSEIPSRLVLGLARDAEKFTEESDEAFDAVLDTVLAICQRSNPAITKEWLLEKTSFRQLLALIKFVLEPLKAAGAGATKGRKGSKSKNE